MNHANDPIWQLLSFLLLQNRTLDSKQRSFATENKLQGGSPVSPGQHHRDRTPSGNELARNIAVDVGQAEVAAIVAEGESLVI